MFLSPTVKTTSLNATLKQYLSCILTVNLIGGGKWVTLRKTAAGLLTLYRVHLPMDGNRGHNLYGDTYADPLDGKYI